MQILKSNQIDRAKWDECVQSSSLNLPYSLSWYLDAVSENWEGCIYNDYEAVFPIVWKRKYGLKLVYNPYYCQQLGFLSKGPVSGVFIQDVLKYLKTFFYVDLNLNYNTLNIDIPSIITKPNYVLNLNKPYSELFNSYSRDLKRCIRSAEKCGLTAEKVIDPDVFLHYCFAFIDKTKLGIKDKHLQLISRLVKECFNKNTDCSYLVRNRDNEVIFCIFTIIYKNRIFGLMNYGNEEGRRLKANHFIINKIIEENSEKQMVFDFEGSSIPKIARFFLNFNPENQFFQKIHFSKFGSILKLLKI